MSRDFSCPSRQRQRQREIGKQASKIGADHFFNLLTGPNLLETVEAHLPEYRERHYPPTTALSMFLGQVLSADGSCQAAVNEVSVQRLSCGLTSRSANTGGYCSARGRLPLSMLSELTRRIGALMGERVPTKWLWRGRHVKLADGTTMLMKDTAQNQAHYPQPVGQMVGVGFPQARAVGVVSLSHGAVLGASMGPNRGKGTGEHALFRELLDLFAKDDVLLADSYYCSYFTVSALQACGADVVLQQHGARATDFRCGRHLGPRDHIVLWRKPERPAWMDEAEYQRHRETLTVREVRVGSKVLVTTLLDARRVSKRALDELYRQRWTVELDLRNIKTTLGMELLRCKTPSMCEKEFWVYLLAYNLIRLLMAEAAVQVGALPRELSFKHTLQVWLAWSARQMYMTPTENRQALFALIACIRVGKRPGRIEPRAVKRRPKQYARLMTTRRKAREIIQRRRNRKKRAA